jgi:NADH dehydrogenase
MLIALTGATGYVGSRVVRKLLRREHDVRALVRRPDRAGPLEDLGVQLLAGDLNDADALAALVAGAGAVVHLVGIIVEARGQTFEVVHVAGTRALLAAANDAGVQLMVHMSALGARSAAGATRYHQTKWQAEEAVRGGGLPHVILRPSLIAGPGNAALKTIVDMIRLSPVVPVIGNGRYELQPVWVEDVAEAFALAVERPDLRGTFDIAGPERLTYHQLLDRLETALGVTRRRMAVPVGMVRFAAAAGAALPNLTPITSEQLQMLLEGNTTDRNDLETRFGVQPRPFALVAEEICAPYAARATVGP